MTVVISSLDIVDWFFPLAAHPTWSKCWLHCLPWTLSSEEHFFLLSLVKHLEELLPQVYSRHWKCAPLWQELYKTNVLFHKRRLVSFVISLKRVMYCTCSLMFHEIWHLLEIELCAQVGSSSVVWPQKWHHTKCLWESGEGIRPSVWLTNSY